MINNTPNLSHTKAFGCKAFTYISKHKRGKLEKKAVEVIFAGYGNRYKGYRIFTEDKNVMIARTTKFNVHSDTNFKELESSLFEH